MTMPVTHEPWLVVLSLIVAIQGAYVGLTLALQVSDAIGLRRRWLLAAAAVSLAVAIWAMHFVGMLAARLPLPIDYLVFPTLLSFLVCVIVVGAAVFAVSAGPLTPARLAASSVFLGGGIATMHYIGMNALHASVHMEHDPTLVAASVAIAIGASALALWFAGLRRRRPSLLISAIAFGTAIAGMHYTAMAGLTIFPHVTPMPRAPALSSDLLAIVVAIVAFLMSVIFLLLLVPERQAVDVRADASDRPHLRDAATQIGVVPPIGVTGPLASVSLACLPIEREGITQFIAVDDIVAVHANAHYTYIFDGTSKLFCSLPISDVEARLDHRRFVRVHRSHIVNMDRVLGLKRAGDNGVIELAAIDRYTVPVSRGRLGSLRSRLSLRPGEVIGAPAASPGTAA
jgi:NO-binding membrane sensor protein with MHYT domain